MSAAQQFLIVKGIFWTFGALIAWGAIGAVAFYAYASKLWRIDGCWTHAIGIKDRIALWLGYQLEMEQYIRMFWAAPILVPIGLVTVHRNGLYGERRPNPFAS